MRLPPFALAAALAAALPAAAHETFFLPAAPAHAGQPLTLALSSGMAFPKPGTGPKAARVAKLGAVIGREPQPAVVDRATPSALLIMVTPESAGPLVVAVDLGAHPIELSAAKVAEYFSEIDPPAEVRAAYAALPAPRQWRELYSKHAKALVCVAPCADPGAARTPRGQALEFVAADAGLRRFVLLDHGQPRPAQPVALFTPAGTVKLRTDAGGAVELPATATGDLLLATTTIRAPASPGAPFTSDFATLSFRRE